MNRIYDVFIVIERNNANDTNDERRNTMARKATTTQKRCTFTGEMFDATREHFYADKSQKDGLSPWSKIGEGLYNAAYHRALKNLGATRVRDLDDASRVKFDAAMKRAKVRIARTGRASTSKAITAKKRVARATKASKASA